MLLKGAFLNVRQKCSTFLKTALPDDFGNGTVAVHYYSSWKKGAAGVHNGFDDLREFPERTPLMGYYNEENPTICDREIKWATEHGINCLKNVSYASGRLPVVEDNARHSVVITISASQV